jgi:hypothetical protein
MLLEEDNHPVLVVLKHTAVAPEKYTRAITTLIRILIHGLSQEELAPVQEVPVAEQDTPIQAVMG